MKRAALGIWGLLVLGSAACSDRGLVVADTNDTTGGAWGDAAGAESGSAGDGDQDHPGGAGGTDMATGGKSSGTGGRQEATGGSHSSDGGSSATTGGRSQGADGAAGGSAADTGGTATGGTNHTGGTNTGGSGGASAGAAGADAGTGGVSGGPGGNDGGAAGSAGTTACTTDECCASVEFAQESLSVYLVDGQFYFDGTVNLLDGPLDLYYWLTTVEVSSEQTGVVQGPMPRSQGEATRSYWVGSTGSSGSGVECGQTLTFQVRVRTDTVLRPPPGEGSESTCSGVYGPSVSIQAKAECPTCPEDAQAAEYDEDTCLYPVTLQCPGQTTDMSGKPVTVGCPCDLSRQPRHWTCPVV